MASLTDCKGMCVLDATPSGCAGRAIQDNFVELTNRIGPCNYNAAAAPTGNDDGSGAIAFSIGSQWRYNNKIWVYAGGNRPNAKWLPIEEWESPVAPNANKIARRNSLGGLCAQTVHAECVRVAGIVCARDCVKSGDDVEEVYRFDARTGTVVKRQRLRLETPRLKRGYAVDPVSGKILRKEDGAEVGTSEAVESRRPREAQSLAEKIAQKQQKKKTS